MPKAYFKPQNNAMGSDQPCRFSLLNSTGSASSYAANQVFTTTANSSYKKQSLLSVCNVSELGFYSGTTMVVQQPGDLQWQTNCVSSLQNSNTIRYLLKGLGALSESVNRGSVDSPGVKPPYQCSGIVSHQINPFNVFENVQSQISPFPIGQYMSALSYLMKMGSTQNKEMIAITKEIWGFALSKEIMLTAEYLPGRLNVMAHWASRIFKDSSEWLLSPRVLQEIVVKWGYLHQEHTIIYHLICHGKQTHTA